MPIFSTLLAVRVDERHQYCMMEWALLSVSDRQAMHKSPVLPYAWTHGDSKPPYHLHHILEFQGD